MDETAPLRDFLRQLDVFVAVPSQSWGPELPWSAVAAMAEGAVVVIDPAYQPHLGGAAVYASAVDVHDELKALADDPDRLGEYRERGYAFCRDVLSEEAAVESGHTSSPDPERTTDEAHTQGACWPQRWPDCWVSASGRGLSAGFLAMVAGLVVALIVLLSASSCLSLRRQDATLTADLERLERKIDNLALRGHRVAGDPPGVRRPDRGARRPTPPARPDAS